MRDWRKKECANCTLYDDDEACPPGKAHKLIDGHCVDRIDPSKKSAQQGSCTCAETNGDDYYCPEHGEYDPDVDPGHPDHSGPVGVDR